MSNGDGPVLDEALRRLEFSPAGKVWWVLEGVTKVDCALFTEKAAVFIEGKRTEGKLTGDTQWDPRRLQIFRNLDCLAERADERSFYMLLVIENLEGAVPKQDSYRRVLEQAKQLDDGPHVARCSLLHRGVDAADRLYNEHFPGWTTWQAIAKEFGNDAASLRGLLQ